MKVVFYPEIYTHRYNISDKIIESFYDHRAQKRPRQNCSYSAKKKRKCSLSLIKMPWVMSNPFHRELQKSLISLQSLFVRQFLNTNLNSLKNQHTNASNGHKEETHKSKFKLYNEIDRINCNCWLDIKSAVYDYYLWCHKKKIRFCNLANALSNNTSQW